MKNRSNVIHTNEIGIRQELPVLKLDHYHYDKYKEDWANMKLEFKKQAKDIEISSEQYIQLQRKFGKKIIHLKTEFKQKLEKKKDKLIEVSKKNRECCICLGKLCCDDAKPAKPLLCGHDAFHEHCVKRWLKNQKTCPECRDKCAIKDNGKFKNVGLSESYCTNQLIPCRFRADCTIPETCTYVHIESTLLDALEIYLIYVRKLCVHTWLTFDCSKYSNFVSKESK